MAGKLYMLPWLAFTDITGCLQLIIMPALSNSYRLSSEYTAIIRTPKVWTPKSEH